MSLASACYADSMNNWKDKQVQDIKGILDSDLSDQEKLLRLREWSVWLENECCFGE